MNKYFIGCFFVLVSSFVFSQDTEFIFNQAEFRFSNNGVFFHNSISNAGAYSPEGYNKKVFYYAGLNIAGVNSSGEILSSYSIYSDIGYAPGPIANNYSDVLYQNKYSESVWIVTKSQIDYHKTNFSEVWYETPSEISDWPGNGNELNGESEILAPFEDLNNNGIYEPDLGEYPCIKGDKCAYVIMNDLNHQNVAPQPLGVEVHMMFYQFLTPEVIDQTTFINMKIINRSQTDLNDLRVGIFSDFDIGGFADDFLGTDTLRNLWYGYNADLFDESVSGSFGFEENPPAAGIKVLNEKLHSTMQIITSSTDGVNYIPNNNAQVYSYLNAHFIDGSHLTYGGTGNDPQNPLTNYTFSGYRNNGWTEESSSNSPSDRTGMMSIAKDEFLIGEHIEYDFAVVYGRSENPNDIWDAVDVMFQNADIAQEFYNNMQASCENPATTISEITELEFQVYPNPASDEVFVQLNGSFEFEIYNVFGKQVIQKSKGFQQEKIDLSHCASGVYFVKVMREGDSSIKKIIKN